MWFRLEVQTVWWICWFSITIFIKYIQNVGYFWNECDDNFATDNADHVQLACNLAL